MPYEDSFNTLYGGLRQMADVQEKRDEETKNRAREFKALQEYADATGYADKNTTTTMDLDSLKGLVRGSEAKRIQGEQQERMGFERRRVNLAEQIAQQELARYNAAAPERAAGVKYHEAQTASLNALMQQRAGQDIEAAQQRSRLAAYSADVQGQMASSGVATGLGGYLNGMSPVTGRGPDLAGYAREFGSITPQGLMGAQARAGVLDPREADTQMRALAAQGGRLRPEFMPQAFDVGGIKGIVSPLTGATHLDPRVSAATKPSAATITLTEKDAKGNTVSRKLTEAQYQAELAAKAARPTVPPAVQKEADRLRRDIMEDEAERAGGDERRWYGAKRADKLKENQSRLAALERQHPSLAQPGRRLIYKMDASGNLTPQ